MKKLIALLLALVMVLALAACTGPKEDINAKSEGTMTYAQYSAADMDAEVTIEAYIQAKTAYSAAYENCNLYLQDGDGGYYAYRVKMDQATYNSLTIGSKVKITGIKTAWQGEVELKEGTSVVTKLPGSYTAEPVDVTSKLGTDDLIKSMNQLVAFKGVKVVAKGDNKAFFYGGDGNGERGADLYFDVSYNGKTFTFCVESDLMGADTAAYKAVEALKVGDTINVEAFLYWYAGPNPHVTGVTVVK